MFAYQLRLAWKSLCRNPVLSLLMVVGIGLGIGVAMTFVTTYYLMAANPIPHKSERLYAPQVDSWNPNEPIDEDHPDEPPHLMTYRDAIALSRSTIPTHLSALFRIYPTVRPDDPEQRPFRRVARACQSGFFPMFDVPFRYGGGWDKKADESGAAVLVLGAELNERLFGGENSVGRELQLDSRRFTIVGVLEPWRPFPRFYDVQNRGFVAAEQLFLPLSFAISQELEPWGNIWNWKPYPGNEYAAFLESEAIWINFWVQLDTEEQKDAYRAHLEAYVLEQRKLGRFERPMNNRLRNVVEWLRYRNVVPEDARTLLINALLFLLVCSVNLVGILLGKFIARAPEIGVRRALGASRAWVFTQHLIECELIGIIGCALGVGLSFYGIRLVERLYYVDFDVSFDPKLLAIALGLALGSAMIAGAYPAWRICRIPPSEHLKAQ